MADKKYLEDIDKRWNELMPFILDYNNTANISTIDEISQKIRQAYLQEDSVSKDTYLKIVQVLRNLCSKQLKSKKSVAGCPIYY